MVPWWQWYYYVNPIAWTLYGIIVTQLGQDTTDVRAKSLKVPRNPWSEAPQHTDSSSDMVLHYPASSSAPIF